MRRFYGHNDSDYYCDMRGMLGFLILFLLSKKPMHGQDREEYIKHYSKPGAMRAGFEYYRSVFEDAEQNKEYAKEKLNIPILTIGGEAGVGNFTTTSFQMVANNVSGITLPNTGHFIPEERPNFVTKQILKFFGEVP